MGRNIKAGAIFNSAVTLCNVLLNLSPNAIERQVARNVASCVTCLATKIAARQIAKTGKIKSVFIVVKTISFVDLSVALMVFKINKWSSQTLTLNSWWQNSLDYLHCRRMNRANHWQDFQDLSAVADEASFSQVCILLSAHWPRTWTWSSFQYCICYCTKPWQRNSFPLHTLFRFFGVRGCLKTPFSPKIWMEGLGMVGMYNVTWQMVTWLHSAYLNSQSFAEFPWKCAKIALNCCVLGHLLVSELILKGWEDSKPCQFQRTVYWHCKSDKVCCWWTRGHKAN